MEQRIPFGDGEAIVHLDDEEILEKLLSKLTLDQVKELTVRAHLACARTRMDAASSLRISEKSIYNWLKRLDHERK